MEKRRCFFIGHRDAPRGIYPELLQVVMRHITTCAVEEFVVGHYGEYDRLAAKAVVEAKAAFPQVKLFCLSPYHPTERVIDLPDGFAGTIYPPGMETVPRRLAIVRANRYMVDHSHFLIAYAWQAASNASALVDYARKREEKGFIQVTELRRAAPVIS